MAPFLPKGFASPPSSLRFLDQPSFCWTPLTLPRDRSDDFPQIRPSSPNSRASQSLRSSTSSTGLATEASWCQVPSGEESTEPSTRFSRIFPLFPRRRFRSELIPPLPVVPFSYSQYDYYSPLSSSSFNLSLPPSLFFPQPHLTSEMDSLPNPPLPPIEKPLSSSRESAKPKNKFRPRSPRASESTDFAVVLGYEKKVFL